MTQTCFQRGLLKEIFFKFYKVQPLIMLSHNQSLQSITVSSLQVISNIRYDHRVLVFWRVQYGSCHWVDLFFIEFLFQNIFGTLHNLFPSLSSCVLDMLLLTDLNTVMQLKRSPMLPESPSDVVINASFKASQQEFIQLGAFDWTSEARNSVREGQFNVPWYSGIGEQLNSGLPYMHQSITVVCNKKYKYTI